MVLGFIVIVIATGLIALHKSSRVMPGVQVLGVELGGKPKAEAFSLLEQNWAARTIDLDVGDTTWAVTPSMLGIMLDTEATFQLAYQQGRSLATLKDILKNGGVDVSPIWRMDRTLAEANLHALRTKFDVLPTNAGLQIADGYVKATPAVPGRTLDVGATVSRLEWNANQVISEGRLELVMLPIQPTTVDVSAAVAQANQLLAHPLFIKAYDPVTDERQTWQLPPEDWGKWLSLSTDVNDPSNLNWALNADEISASLDTQATTLGPDRHLDVDEAIAAITKVIKAQSTDVFLRIYHGEQQHVVQPGETLSSIAQVYGLPYPWIQAANPGMGDNLSVGQILTIPSPDELLPLPVVENKRIMVSLSQQKAWVYENDALKWEWPVSTGIDSSPTAPGVFQIQTHELNAYASNWNLWMPHFMGIYRPVPTFDFMNGFHGFPTRGGSTLLWTDDLGHPVTYGCILISSENAAMLYEWAEAGVVVEVRP